ncbi:sensor histidine kinase [Flavihumibacter petaseus]|uniref:histidine kinase n=1 Tax=Flavihumibacter petaseus NBRC 106054 TaxID=1220578 RepID=A0A0E9MYS6_9BACT|nr:ATP-binding protein [Flavihumibacter petaseus]GAO42867.1 putative two-component histidine kinase [Flavihumibacter petaseus NBRC 106054]
MKRLRFLPRQKLAVATAIYWFLLLYIIAALFFWYIRLQQQNQQMASYKLLELVADDPKYIGKVETIQQEADRKAYQYRGEGITFLAIILVGAVFVFRAVRRQFKVAAQQHNFMMAITHELKTPIAVAKLNLETLLKHRLEESRQQKILQMTLQETNRLNDLTNNILISSQLEAGGYQKVQQEVDLTELGNKMIQEMRQRFPDNQFNFEAPPDLSIKGDPLLIRILISNLLDNAVKYSPRGAVVDTVMKQTGKQVVIEVRDPGPGIPDAEKQRIFKRFYRIGNEEVRKAKGTGLGLYLCRKIAADHHGTVAVTDNTPAGAIFTITLPSL